jgi:phage-related protein
MPSPKRLDLAFTDIWRIVYRLDHDAIVIADVFSKKTQATPAAVIRNCQRRLAAYDAIG